MKKNKWKVFGSVLLLAVCSLVIVQGRNRHDGMVSSKNIEEVTITVYSDYPTYDSLKDLENDSTYIVEGQYTGLLSTWNADRLPSDPSQEDPTSYSEGRKYGFTVSRVLKGEDVPEEIEINKVYSVQAKYLDENGEEIAYQLPTQYYTEPQIGETYLLFLNYDAECSGTYFSAGEPGEIMMGSDGLSETCSNLFNPPANQPEMLTTYAEGENTIYRISFPRERREDLYQDFLSGIPWEELLDQVKAAAE
jgi:hypothetical protein